MSKGDTLRANDERAVGTRRAVAFALVLVMVLLGFQVGRGDAALPPMLWQAPADGQPGPEAGHFLGPHGIASRPDGDVLVADPGTARVDVFDAWGQFREAFGWGVVDGSNALQTCGPTTIPPTNCRGGVPGDRVGQMKEPNGVAVDNAGNIYVAEYHNLRVQKFDPSGDFLLMFGGEVNKTKSAEPGSTQQERDICSAQEVAAGDQCGAGVAGTGPGQFSLSGFPGWLGLSIRPNGNVLAGNANRIEEFDPSGLFLSETSLPEPGSLGALAVDPLTGDSYFAFELINHAGAFEQPNVHRLSSTGLSAGLLEVSGPAALAVNPDGDVFVADTMPQPLSEGNARIVEFDSTGRPVIVSDDGFAEGPDDALRSFTILGLAVGAGCGIDGEDIYASYIGDGQSFLRAFGPPPDPSLCPPPATPPSITEQYAASVTSDGAVLRAKINPHLWEDAHYYVEYGVGKCAEGGCGNHQPVVPGAQLGGGVTDHSVETSDVSLINLMPESTYHYRFVAESSGGGPVFGIAKGGREATRSEGAEGTFTTATGPAVPDTSCPNQAFRTGASALLPDCRAYEMVSPVDKGNTDVVAPGFERLAAFNQASVTGGGLAYASARSFGDAQSAPFTAEYIASRGDNGWSSSAVSPPRGVNLTSSPVTLDTQYKLFSPNLCSGWLLDETDKLLSPGAVEGFANLYERANCGPEAGAYLPLSTAAPPRASRETYHPELQGVSADGTRVIFRAPDKLTANAPELSTLPSLLYESANGGKPRFVCLFPNGLPVTQGCSAGTATGDSLNARHETVTHAISDDGSRIFWTDTALGEGQIYVRLNGKKTLPVSEAGEALSGESGAQFWTAAADGSKVIYTVGDLENGSADLYEFTVESPNTRLIAKEVSGVLGADETASRLYFISGEASAGGTAGEPNLFFYEAGSPPRVEFVATLSRHDAAQWESTEFSPGNADLSKRTAFVTADGLHVAFMSTAHLTAAENADLTSGEADAEVYVYDADSRLLSCASCNPTGARPTGRPLGHAGESDRVNPSGKFWAGAEIPRAEDQLYAPHVLSDGGNRLFFESFEPLVSEDTNGAEDVYEWETPGEGDCSQGSPSFRAFTHGCVGLISSGKNPTNSELIDASPDGRNVFIATESSLLPQDPGLIDIYDARVEGGFPPPPPRPAPCEGETCQNSPPPPNDATPSSSSFSGPGNVAKAPFKPRCSKRKAAKKRCAKRQRRHNKPKKPRTKRKKSGSAHRAVGHQHGGAK